jgi:hypothetical protein
MTESWVGGLIAIAVLLALVVGLAKLIDLWRQRRRERAALRGMVTDALMREERLAGTTVVPKVRIPFWSSSPAAVVLTGLVPDPEAHATALRVARTAAAAVRDDVVVHDRTALSGRADQSAA